MAIPAPLPPSESDLSGHRRIAIVVALALAAGFVWGVLRLSQLRGVIFELNGAFRNLIRVQLVLSIRLPSGTLNL